MIHCGFRVEFRGVFCAMVCGVIRMVFRGVIRSGFRGEFRGVFRAMVCSLYHVVFK